jgi:hypothetical protein
LKKHEDVKHGLLAKKLNEEVNSSRRTQVERQPIKKRQNVSSSKISKIFSAKLPYKKDEMQQKQFLKDLTLMIVKSHLLVHLLENPWLTQFSLQLNLHIVFPSRKTFSEEILLDLVQKTKDVYVLLELSRACQLLQVLICECQTVLMTFLPWSLTFWMKIGNLRR